MKNIEEINGQEYYCPREDVKYKVQDWYKTKAGGTWAFFPDGIVTWDDLGNPREFGREMIADPTMDCHWAEKSFGSYEDMSEVRKEACRRMNIPFKEIPKDFF